MADTNHVPAAHKGSVISERSPESDIRVTIRFAGDSGDGMQLTGTQFTGTTALAGNDLATLPDFPAEIRAPAGTIAGVSGFQIQFGSMEIFTPGDRPDVLVAMNPAALKKNLVDMVPGSTIVVNKDAFVTRACEKVGFEGNPLETDVLDEYKLISVPLTTMTRTALEDLEISTRDKDRCKNFVALGIMYWMYDRKLEYTIDWIGKKFAKKPLFAQANVLALKAGFHFGDTIGLSAQTLEVPPNHDVRPGTYRNITGNTALAYGFIAASQLSGLDLFLGSYPITPASDILHELSKHKNYRVKTFQAEDEIAAVAATIGAAFGGALAITTTSGPGVALKGEAIGLGIITELPIVVINVQRGGPSTGLPTKTEQSDLMQAMFGRNGECPMPIVAPATPSNCFDVAIEAARIALKYMTPVMMLSDGYLANGAEPWCLPKIEDLPEIPVEFETDPEGFSPYKRNPETLSRPWARPGTPGLEHRIGGLEKADGTGNVSYDPANHEHMTKVRAEKVARIANDIPLATVYGPDEGDVLIVGWGGTYGALRAATMTMQRAGRNVSHLHLRHIHPMARNVEAILRSFKHVVCAELNMGQLRALLRERFLIDIKGINKIQGQPFRVSEIMDYVTDIIEERD